MLMTAEESLNNASLGENSLTYDGWNLGGEAPLVIQGSSTPAVNSCAFGEYQLSSGSATIDLTAARHLTGQTVNASSCPIVGLIVKTPVGNGAAITLAKAGSNGHTGLGSAFSLRFDPKDHLQKHLAGNTVLVSSTDKALTLTGTGSSDKLQVGFLFGVPAAQLQNASGGMLLNASGGTLLNASA